MQIGESIERLVLAKDPWNASGLSVQPGERYRFDVEVREVLKDKDLPATPAGLRDTPGWMKAMGFLRRSRDHAWFALLGSAGRSSSGRFLVGAGGEWTAPLAGELHFYVNDSWGFYHNNQGRVAITVTRLS